MDYKKSNISKLRPGFDPRLYGYKKLSEVIKAFPKKFAIEDIKTSGGKALRVRIR